MGSTHGALVRGADPPYGWFTTFIHTKAGDMWQVLAQGVSDNIVFRRGTYIPEHK